MGMPKCKWGHLGEGECEFVLRSCILFPLSMSQFKCVCDFVFWVSVGGTCVMVQHGSFDIATYVHVWSQSFLLAPIANQLPFHIRVSTWHRASPSWSSHGHFHSYDLADWSYGGAVESAHCNSFAKCRSHTSLFGVGNFLHVNSAPSYDEFLEIRWLVNSWVEWLSEMWCDDLYFPLLLARRFLSLSLSLFNPLQVLFSLDFIQSCQSIGRNRRMSNCSIYCKKGV